MGMLYEFITAAERLRTWFKEKSIAIRAAFKLKHIDLVPQDTSSTNRHKNSDKMKFEEDLSLEQYLKTAQGQKELSQAKIKFGEEMLRQLTMRYHNLKEPPSTAQKMMISLAIQQTVRELQLEEEKAILN